MDNDASNRLRNNTSCLLLQVRSDVVVQLGQGRQAGISQRCSKLMEIVGSNGARQIEQSPPTLDESFDVVAFGGVGGVARSEIVRIDSVQCSR